MTALICQRNEVYECMSGPLFPLLQKTQYGSHGGRKADGFLVVAV